MPLFSFLTLDGLRHLFMPALEPRAVQARAADSSDARRVRTRRCCRTTCSFARAKGSPSGVIGMHVLKNILIPIVTVLGLEFGSLIAFAIVTETSSPGPAWASF